MATFYLYLPKPYFCQWTNIPITITELPITDKKGLVAERLG